MTPEEAADIEAVAEKVPEVTTNIEMKMSAANSDEEENDNE